MDETRLVHGIIILAGVLYYVLDYLLTPKGKDNES